MLIKSHPWKLKSIFLQVWVGTSTIFELPSNLSHSMIPSYINSKCQQFPVALDKGAVLRFELLINGLASALGNIKLGSGPGLCVVCWDAGEHPDVSAQRVGSLGMQTQHPAEEFSSPHYYCLTCDFVPAWSELQAEQKKKGKQGLGPLPVPWGATLC